VAQTGGGELILSWTLVGTEKNIEDRQRIGEILVVVLGFSSVVDPVQLWSCENKIKPRQLDPNRRVIEHRQARQISLQIGHRTRELALFNPAIDSKLRSCDLVRLRVRDVCQGSIVAARTMVMQQKGAYRTHTLRRTKASLIYRRTKNLRVVQLLLGHTKLESTVRYLGIEVDDALKISERTEV